MAQLGGVHLACEQASNVLTKVLEWGRLAAYLEQSTRYMFYDKPLGDRYRYFIPPEVDQAGLGDSYRAEIDALFESYSALTDRLTRYFETRLVMDVIDLLSRLGFYVLVAPFMPNGKPLHVHGFMSAFDKAAKRNAQMLQQIADEDLPLIGIDPSMTLTYRQEYKDVIEGELPPVQLIQEWLSTQTERFQSREKGGSKQVFRLMAHCTEKTSAAPSLRQWQNIFAALGQELEVVSTGCCGMSGTFGHESDNLQRSKDIYELSWRGIVNQPENKGRLVAEVARARRRDESVLEAASTRETVLGHAEVPLTNHRRAVAGVTKKRRHRHDFLIQHNDRVVNIGNAPSPAATSAIPIGRHICDLVMERSGFS